MPGMTRQADPAVLAEPWDGVGHDRRVCGASKRQGDHGPCRRPAGWGTDHPGFGRCKLHGGSTASGVKEAQRERALRALGEIGETLGELIDVDPLEALVEKLHEAFGHAAFLKAELERAQRLFGPDHLGDARPHILWTMWSQERDRAVKIAAECHKAGISEREVQIAELQAQIFASVIRAIVDDPELGLTPAQLSTVPQVVRRHLTAIPVRSSRVA